MNFKSEDRGSMFLRKVGTRLLDCMVSQHGIPQSETEDLASRNVNVMSLNIGTDSPSPLKGPHTVLSRRVPVKTP
jgi:hypothetical protein